MSFKVIERATNRKLAYELLLVVSLIVSEIQAVLMLKTTFLVTPLEFEGHVVEMRR